MISFSIAFLLVLLCSFFFTIVLRRYALAASMLDVPNSRSSHSIPTPRGGGVAIVVVFLCSLGFLFYQEILSAREFAALFGSGILVSIIGFVDDHGHLAARWRLLGHFLAAIWALTWIGGLPPIPFFGGYLNVSWFGNILATIYLVWMLNLYNFMDGIDGIAGMQAVFVCAGGALLYFFSGKAELVSVPLFMMASVIGFLCWNFPPAKIFMGDAGSGFLGIMLAVFSLQAGWAEPQLIWGWLILLGVFVVDATFTLARRFLRGEKVYEAHRSHAYQVASRRLRSHLLVTLSVLAINVFWLLPIAISVVFWRLNGVVALAIAYMPLTLLAVKFNSGAPEGSESLTRSS